MVIILVLMVKNEEAILTRCLDSVDADAYLIVDTGSTDNTIEVARQWLEGKRGQIVQHPWRDFGRNRTRCFQEAQDYAESLGSLESYALMMDADMVLRGELRPSAWSAAGYCLLQKSGSLEYRNVRLLKLSHPWTCIGPTHEYWSGGEAPLLEGAWIEDLGDGGCKEDKFQRDEDLLLRALQKEDSPRNIFYLAQTYHCQGRHEEAAQCYLRRVGMGGWFEEVWYSQYMLAKSYCALGKPLDAELWAQRAYELEPNRWEPLMLLVSYFREASQHYKAWHYLKLAEGCKATEGLFLETDRDRLDFERSVLAFYVGQDGLQPSLKYEGPQEHTVLSNLRFYATKILGQQKRLSFPEVPGFHSGSIAVNKWGQMCVRCVNYTMTRDGCYVVDGKAITRNFRSQWIPRSREWEGWEELTVTADMRMPDAGFLGLEDVRLQGNVFTATTQEFSYCKANRIVFGTFSDMNFRVLRPPTETECEKNWLPVDSERLIYHWHPFTVLRGEEVITTLETSGLFKHFRGSAPPFRVDERLLSIVHVCCPSVPRTYLHLFVEHDCDTLTPVRHSKPFYFRELGIEYCLSASQFGSFVHLFFSCWDTESWVCTVPAAVVLDSLDYDTRLLWARVFPGMLRVVMLYITTTRHYDTPASLGSNSLGQAREPCL